MSEQKFTQQTETWRGSPALPATGLREYIPVRPGPALDELEQLIEASLNDLMVRLERFQSPQSLRRYLER